MPPLAPKEARQVARGCVPVAAARDWTGGRREDLARVVVAKVGFGMLDLVRVGFAAQSARDPLAFHSAVDSFAAREARAARGGVTAFLGALNAGGWNCEPDKLEKRLWNAVEGAAAVVEGGTGRNPGLDEVLEELGVSEKDFERAAGGVGPVCPIAVDPFSYEVVVRSVLFKDALATLAADHEEVQQTSPEQSVLAVERTFAAGVPRNS